MAKKVRLSDQDMQTIRSALHDASICSEEAASLDFWCSTHVFVPGSHAAEQARYTMRRNLERMRDRIMLLERMEGHQS